MGTGWVSVSPSPLSENTPPPVGRVPYRLTVPTGQAVATASNEVTSKQPKRVGTQYSHNVPQYSHGRTTI